MKPSSRSIVALAAALSLGLAGCSSDESSDASNGGDMCTQLEDISTFEMESQSSAAIDPSDWPAMQQVLQEYGDGIPEHYDPAIETADDDIAADLTTVRDASIQVTSLVTESPTFEEYQKQTEATIDVDSFTAARDASSRIDAYAKENCEFAKEAEQPQDGQAPQMEQAPQQDPAAQDPAAQDPAQQEPAPQPAG